MNSRPIAAGVVVQDVSPDEVFQVMTGATSQDPAQVQACSKRFTELLQMQGTFEALHSIAAEKSVALPVRQQSIIQFKNSALSQWRSRKFLSDEQRSKIRARCMTFVNEEDETIAACNKVIVSKIARNDYPNSWPNLIDDLMSAIEVYLQERYETPAYDERRTLPLRRSLQLLNGIVKEFTAFKMLHGVRAMITLFNRLHLVLHGYYSKISTFFSPTSMNNQMAESIRTFNDIQLANLVYKCTAKMTVWVWQRLDRDKNQKEGLEGHQPWINQFFQESAIQLKHMADLRHRIISSGTATSSQSQKTVELITKHVLAMGKFFRKLSHASHPRFVQLPLCDDLILFYWGQVVNATGGPPDLIGDSNNVLYPIRFLVQGMVLFKENLSQWAPTRKDGTPNPNTVLPMDFIQNAVRLIVTRFMPLNQRDLENWVNDPEEWMSLEDKDTEQWEFEIRSCSERLLMSLAKEYGDYVTPLLLETYQNFAVQAPVDIDSVIQKEALYCALGRCCFRLQNDINFNDWLSQTLSVEAKNTNPNFPVIKRRIAWLIGRWISEGATSPNNPLIWETLGHLLTDRQQGTDVVVRLTAATAIGECVRVNQFDPEVFSAFLGATISELVALMAEADTFESKRRVDHALNLVIEFSGNRVVPFVPVIIGPLPGLWTTAGEDWMFKTSLLAMVTTLITAIKEQSSSLGAIVVPLVKDSLTPPARTNLDEQGLSLWLTALRNTITIQSVKGAPPLVDLFPEAVATLANNHDLMGTAIDIIESYLLLDGSYLLQNAAKELFTACFTALSNVEITTNVKDLTIALNLLVQVSPASLWGAPMHETGLFAYILNTLIRAKGSHLILTEYVLLIARIVIADRQTFLQLMAATANQHKVEEQSLYTGLLDEWWSKFDNMSEPRHRKLCAMGMAALVSTGRPEALERIPGDIFNMWLDVFGEIKEAAATLESLDNMPSPTSPTNLRRHWELDEAPHTFFKGTDGTPEYDRRKALYDADPVRTVQLSSFVARHLREAEVSCGQQNFQQLYLSKVDPTVLKQIQDELQNV